jgi:UDP-2-acetamido-3-amino-2,3-dideoxy-glucuronate N-acetyltransferase
VDRPCRIGEDTKIWHFCHVMAGARIGRECTLGQNVFVAGGAIIGSRVKIQNNVSIYDGVVIEDDVFLGPSAVLTNVRNPRAEVSRRDAFEATLLRQGCTIGANATIVCGVTVGRYAFVAAGAVVTRDLPDHVLATGVPARAVGWMSHEGHRLGPPDSTGVMRCPETGRRYALEQDAVVVLD